MKKLCVIIALAFMMCGCEKRIDPDEFLASATNLLEQNAVEDFTYVETSVVDSTNGDFIYHYKSNVRELSFYVETYIDNNGTRVYYTNYYETIKTLYIAAIKDYLDSADIQYSADTDEIIVELSEEYASRLRNAIEHCNLLYAVENQYHEDVRFTEKHPAIELSLKIADGTSVMSEYVDGFRDAESFYDDFCVMYEYKVLEGNK